MGSTCSDDIYDSGVFLNQGHLEVQHRLLRRADATPKKLGLTLVGPRWKKDDSSLRLQQRVSRRGIARYKKQLLQSARSDKRGLRYRNGDDAGCRLGVDKLMGFILFQVSQ